MLKDVAINTTAIELEKILDSELPCDDLNLKQYFYDKVIKDKHDLEEFINEVEEKGKQDIPLIKKTLEVFKSKIKIYNRYLHLIEKKSLLSGN